MLQYLIKRLVGTAAVFFAVATLVFLMMQAAPGSAVAYHVGVNPTQAEIDRVTSELGLDRPMLVQYGIFMGNMLRGDLGQSMLNGRPVMDLLISRAGPTLELGIVTAVLVVLIAILLGIVAARKRGTFWDGLIRVSTVVGISIPNFWLGLMLLMIFGTLLQGVLPTGGWTPFLDDPVAHIKHLVLPSFVLGLGSLAIVARTLRASMLDVLQRDYVRFAHAMGMPGRKLVRRVALPNAVLPTTTVIGMLVGFLVSGSVIVETVFRIPGVGFLMVDSFRKEDIPVGVGAALFTALVYLIMNIVVDLAYAYLNPKIREQFRTGGRVAS